MVKMKKLSEEHKQKLSQIKKADYVAGKFKMPSRKGAKHSAESRIKMKISNKGKGHLQSEETRLKISSSNLGNRGRLGMNLTDSHRKKIAESIMAGNFKVVASYDGVNFMDEKEMLFAMWCDSSDISWKYNSFLFKTNSGKYYIPDFWLPELGEFIEIGSMNEKKLEKMGSFVGAGNVLHYLPNFVNFAGLSEETVWSNDRAISESQMNRG